MSKRIRARVVLALCFVACSAGCVKRTLTITSDPEGATVTVDGQKVGTTPLDMPFTFYGTREILLEKEGYSTFKARHEMNSPVWELFPFDFIPEVMIPFTINDASSVHFGLTALSDPVPEALLERAEAMRKEARPASPSTGLDTPAQTR